MDTLREFDSKKNHLYAEHRNKCTYIKYKLYVHIINKISLSIYLKR